MAQDTTSPRPRRAWLRRLLFLAVLAGLGFLVYLWLRPGVPEGAVLVIDLHAPVAERAEETPLWLRGGAPFDLLGLRHALVTARDDPRVVGVLVRAGAGSVNLAQAEEVRGLLLAFRRGGKFVVGFAEGVDTAGYLALCGADEVIAARAQDLNVLGVTLRALFLAEALEKYGLEFDLVRVGEYKGAYEQLTQKTPSPEFREALEDTAESLYTVLVEEIAASRKLTPVQVRSAIDRGPLSPAEAQVASLVDRVSYPDELEQVLAARSGSERPVPLALASYLEAVGEASGAARVAVVHVRGIITDRADAYLPFLEFSGADEVAAALRQAREDDQVRGVVLRIDSPGGTVSGAERLWREVDITRKTKPVVASLGGTAASGGYYLACAADQVVARPGSLTGSIGVFGGKLVAEKLMELRGLKVETASRGQRADMFDFTRRFNEDQRRALESAVEESYRLFLDHVARGRKKPYHEVERLARGRVWTGSQAKEMGLVDELGGLEEAAAAVRSLARLGEDEHVKLVPLPPRQGLLDLLRGRSEAPSFSLQAALGALDGPLALGPLIRP